jgi:hypothetical protein
MFEWRAQALVFLVSDIKARDGIALSRTEDMSPSYIPRGVDACGIPAFSICRISARGNGFNNSATVRIVTYTSLRLTEEA